MQSFVDYWTFSSDAKLAVKKKKQKNGEGIVELLQQITVDFQEKKLIVSLNNSCPGNFLKGLTCHLQIKQIEGG